MNHHADVRKTGNRHWSRRLDQGRRRVHQSFIFVLALGAAAAAHETDQFSVPLGREFADLRTYLSNDFRRVIVRGVEITNGRIERALKRRASEAELARLQSAETVARNVWSGFPPVINQIERIDATLHGARMKSRYPGLVVAYRPWIWIYHHPVLLLDFTKAVRLGRSSTIMVDGVYFGTDKIAHFVHMGIIYYQEYVRVKKGGAEEQEAMRRAIQLGTGGHLFFSENALLGLLSTGVRSNADLAANYLGFKFFRNLTDHEKLRGRVEPPLLVREGDFWRINDHVRENTDWFRVFVSDHWNEALNPNSYGPGIGNWVCEGIRSRCASILNWYLDETGRPRTQEGFLGLARGLSTYFGEDYGYMGVPEELIGVHRCCFQEPVESQGSTESRAGRDDGPGGGPVVRAAALTDDAPESGGAQHFWEGVRGGDPTAAQRIVADLETVHLANIDGDTLLHEAVRRGSGEFVRQLLGRRADASARGLYGATPLHAAVRSMRPEIVELLLNASANVDARDDFGCTPLHDAAARGDVLTIKLLLDRGAKVRALDLYGNTPLHRAARAGQTAAVSMLLEKGADPLFWNQFGVTAAEEAADMNHRAALRLLRSAIRERKGPPGHVRP